MALSRIERISDGPPRGISSRCDSRRRMNSTAASWRVSSTSTSESCGQPGLGQALAQHGGDGDVRADRARRAPEERGVAGLQAQPEGVAGDVGAVLVDDRDHAERHPHPLDAQPVRPHPAVGDLADRVGQRRRRRGARWPWRGAGCRRGAGGRPRWRPDRRPRRPPRRRRWRRGSRRGGRGAGRPPPAGRRPSPRWTPWPAPGWRPWRGRRARRSGPEAPGKCRTAGHGSRPASALAPGGRLCAMGTARPARLATADASSR